MLVAFNRFRWLNDLGIEIGPKAAGRLKHLDARGGINVGRIKQCRNKTIEPGDAEFTRQGIIQHA